MEHFSLLSDFKCFTDIAVFFWEPWKSLHGLGNISENPCLLSKAVQWAELGTLLAHFLCLTLLLYIICSQFSRTVLIYK